MVLNQPHNVWRAAERAHQFAPVQATQPTFELQSETYGAVIPQKGITLCVPCCQSS